MPESKTEMAARKEEEAARAAGLRDGDTLAGAYTSKGMDVALAPKQREAAIRAVCSISALDRGKLLAAAYNPPPLLPSPPAPTMLSVEPNRSVVCVQAWESKHHD